MERLVFVDGPSRIPFLAVETIQGRGANRWRT